MQLFTSTAAVSRAYIAKLNLLISERCRPMQPVVYNFTWYVLSIASSYCMFIISHDSPKIRRRLLTETTLLNLERLSRLNGGDSQV